jgi:hypothetical protein
MMKAERSLKEVWGWEDAVYRKSKDKSAHGIADTVRREAAALKKSTTRRKTRAG